MKSLPIQDIGIVPHVAPARGRGLKFMEHYG